MTRSPRTELIAALLDRTAAGAAASPFVTVIPGVTILRADRPKPPMPLVQKPALCLVAQGAKRGLFGDTQVEYRAGQALVVTIETPAVGWVTEATSDVPFLGMAVELDRASMRDVLADIGLRAAPPSGGGGVFIADAADEVVRCCLRLVRLLDRPEAVAFVAPLVARELAYWLLTAPYGARIASMMLDGGRESGIVAAIHALRSRFTESLRIDELASEARMSASAFHRRFKLVTSMTPLQYQKQLRLLEARQRMLSHGTSAETTAHQVGYESQSQFSREYARMFGAPPRRDVAAQRAG